MSITDTSSCEIFVSSLRVKILFLAAGKDCNVVPYATKFKGGLRRDFSDNLRYDFKQRFSQKIQGDLISNFMQRERSAYFEN